MKIITCDILIHDTRILTGEMSGGKETVPVLTVRDHVSVGIRDGKIVAVEDAARVTVECGNGDGAAAGGSSALQGDGGLSDVCVCRASQVIDGRHLLWMPGLTDGHMHTCQQLLRGKILDELPMIWTRIMLPFESTLTPEAVRISANLAALEMISGGTTSFVDAGGIHMDEAAKVYINSGLRGALTFSTMDDTKVPPSMRADADECIRRLDEFYDRWNGTGDGRIQAFYSLRSLISCSEELIRGVFQAAKRRGAMVEAHMNEYPNEINFHLERYQLRPLEYLDSLGLLSDRFLCAHSILLSEREMELMEERGVRAVHCPFSNCGKGVPNTPALLKRGIPVGFGTDGTAHGGMSIFQEMKIFRSIMNIRYGVPEANPVIMPADTILSMALSGGSYALGMENTLGEIREGNYADLIAINLDQPHLYPTNNLVHTLVESASSQDVIHSIVNGQLVMKDRQILMLDEERIRRETALYLQNNHLLEEEICYRS